MEQPLLKVEGLCIGLARRAAAIPVVEGVSLRLEPGQALGLVGESGSGKSLTALSLMGLLPESVARVTAGSIRFRGEELVSASPGRLRALRGRELAMVFQDPMTNLNPVLTVGDQLAEPLRVHRGHSRRQARAAAVELLRSVGFASPELRAQAYPHELSGGMRQRALIAAALACDPSLLIADEPTTALDVTVQAQILALLDRERRRRGMALLLISHDLGVVASSCDEVAVMYAGRLVEQGPVGRVFAAPAHPYTAGLLRAVRALDGAGARTPLPVIPGLVPSVDHFFEPGCRFHDRCSESDGLCEARRPEWTSTDGRGAACHHPLAPP